MLQTTRIKFYLTTSIDNDGFNVNAILLKLYEMQSLNNEIKRMVVKEGCFSEEVYPFVIKRNLSTLGCSTEPKPFFIGSQINVTQDDSSKSLLGFNPEIIYEKYRLSPHLLT